MGNMMTNQDKDYLIMLGKASWHPYRYKRAHCGGDLWVWNNVFGSCLGGSHPLINSPYKKSSSLYTVLNDHGQRSLPGLTSSCAAFNSEVSGIRERGSEGRKQTGTSRSTPQVVHSNERLAGRSFHAVWKSVNTEVEEKSRP